MTLMPHFQEFTVIKKTCLALLTIYALAVFSYGIYGAIRGSSDQKTFYYTTKLLLEQKDPFKIGCEFIKQVPPEYCYFYYKGVKEAGGYGLYPPSTHIIFLPFSGFGQSANAAKIWWLVWNMVFLAVIFYVIKTRYLAQSPPLYTYLLLCITIGSPATKTNLSLGQTGLFCCAAFLATIALKDKNRWLSGFAFALAVSKPSMMIFYAAYLTFKKEYRIVMTAVGTHLLLTLGISAWVGISPVELMSNYFEKVSLSFSHPGSLMVLQTAGISFKSFLPFCPVPDIAKSIFTLFCYSVAVLVIYKIKDRNEYMVLGTIGLITLLVDYHHHYDFVILLLMFPAFSALLHSASRPAWPFFYYLILMLIPNLTRFAFFSFNTSAFFSSHTSYLLLWQIFYTTLFCLLLYLYLAKTDSGDSQFVAS